MFQLSTVICKRFSVAILVMLILATVACEDPNGGSSPSSPDETSYANGDYSVKVDNDSSLRLVAFKNAVELSSLIGLVPAGASGHGLPRTNELFPESGDFLLTLVKEKDYFAYYDDLSLTPIYTKLYAYYNASSKETVSFKISGNLGGDSTFTVNNTTKMNAEIREGGPTGDVLGYVPSYTVNFKLYLGAGTYDIVPIFKQYSSLLDEMVEVYAKTTAGKPVIIPYELDPDAPVILNLDDTFLGSVDITPNAAYITFHNQAANTGVYINSGVEPLYTSTGKRVVNAGKSLSFNIDMQYSGGVVGASRTISNLNITAGTHKVSIDSFEFAAGSVYEINITGDAINGLNASTPSKVGDIDFDALFN